MTEDFLLQVKKPGRYIGREWNLPKKEFGRSKVRFALCFPDLYEVGMSNLGVRILYGLLNSQADVACERVFSCDTDMEQALGSVNREIFSLESQSRLSEFDFLGFSLGYELLYTNVLNILQQAKIPLFSSERNSAHPLVIAGGPCVLNPEPMHEFFDLFIIGEAEEALVKLIKVYAECKEKYKSSLLSRQELLSAFSRIEGVYVPSLYEAQYDAGGAFLSLKPKSREVPEKIKKQFISDLDKAYFPCAWLVPYIQIIHDRITLELMRGCPNRCRFCQARTGYYPFRMRSLENILRLAEATYQSSGYETISLCGLSVSDYPGIEDLLQRLISMFKTKGVSISLPSIKAKPEAVNLSGLIASVKKTGLTLAPEAGSQKLRDILGKDFSEEDFFKAVEEAYRSGYQHVKLYFMTGLPFEEKADLDSIGVLAQRVSELRKKFNRPAAQVNISINSLIPKPHTAFQWFAMEGQDTAREKQNYLRDKLRNKRFTLNFHNREMSFLEGVLSRGDRRLSRVILAAFRLGAKFDAWTDHFSFATWQEAFRQTGVDPASYLGQIDPRKALPWDFIDTGISKDLLLEEFNKLIDMKEDKLYNSSDRL